MLGKKQTGKITRGEESKDKYEAMKINIRAALREFHTFKSKGVMTKTKTGEFLKSLDPEISSIIKDIMENPDKEQIYSNFLEHDISKIPKFEDIDDKYDLMKGIAEDFTLPAFGVKPIITVKTEDLIEGVDGSNYFDEGEKFMTEEQKEKLSNILEEVNDPTEHGLLDEDLGINADFLKSFDFFIELGDDDFLFMIPPEYLDISSRLDEMADYRTTMTSVADIPIYFVISNPYTPHLTTIILYKSNLYSFGYGFSGSPSDEKGRMMNERLRVPDKRRIGIPLIQHFEQASIYTPDYLILENLKIRHQDDMLYGKQKRTRGNIVDVGIFDRNYCSKLKKTLEKVTMVKLYVRCHKQQVGKTRRMKSCGVTHLTIEVDETYSQLSNNYCRDDNRNCTSFVTQLFPNINCNIFKIIPFLVHPHFCYKSRGEKIDIDVMRTLYDIYRGSNGSPTTMIDFMKRIAGDSPSPSSRGKASKGKARKGGKRNKTVKK